MAVNLPRLAGLIALCAGIEVLERVAFRAGVDAAGAAADTTLTGLRDDPADVADCSDVLDAHGVTVQ